MKIKFYNSLTKEKEDFKPLKDKLIRMYVCGPTVYGPSHLGHAVTYIRFDFIRRYLEFLGYKVRFVMNITDIHDDILKKSRELNVKPKNLADKYTKEFYKDIESLKIKKAFKYPRVSDHLKEIINLIKILIKKGYAYETSDGVYFSVSKFKGYGKLSGRKLESAVTGTRVKTDKYEKEEVVDFALWKKENDEWLFNSPWGKGRPGWHIECSAMSIKYLGMPFDIHGGAIDLIFPHHENEIAQSEAAYEKKFVNFYLHSGLLYVNGQKMSKSLGNYIELRDYLKENSPRFLRFFVFKHHYRSPIDFNEENIKEAKSSFESLNEKIAKLEQIKNLKGKKSLNIKSYEKKVLEALNDDFNSPLALSYIFELLNEAENLLIKDELKEKSRKELLNFLKKLDKFMLFLFPWQKIDKKIINLVKKREKLRNLKKFEEADKIREELKKLGIKVVDIKNRSVVINIR
ncbi:MAG: cysteine--tRNA ligase [Candidatus Pacebacteria bacterium]|jgi:cysteinyl-tRNA synthetase|nr:cysteine--tRNA ligase [Candidatus Paceibacterota bacterium]